MTTAPLRLCSTVFLHVQDSLLPEKDKKLPFPGHVVGAPQHIHFIEDVVLSMLMGTQEVIVSNPQGQVITGPVDAIETVCMTVGGLIGAVEPFYHLFVRAVLCGDGIAVEKSENLCNPEGKGFAQLFGKFHCGKGIGAVTIGNKLKIFRKLCKAPESHTHGKDTGADTVVVAYLVAIDAAGSRIHDKPDIGFNAAYFNVGFIGGKYAASFVWVLDHKGFYADGGSFTVVGDLLVGNADVVQVFECLRCFTQGKAQADMEGQAQRHDMCIMPAEFQGRGVFGKGKQVHAEKIHREFAVDVVQPVFIFSIILLQVLFINPFKVVEIVWAPGIHTFVEDKVFTFLFWDKDTAAVGTAEFYSGKTAISRGETGTADFTQKLSLGAVVPI